MFFVLNGIIFFKYCEIGNFKKLYFGWIFLCILIKILVIIIVSMILRMILVLDFVWLKFELVFFCL